jgi:hypothetical protein
MMCSAVIETGLLSGQRAIAGNSLTARGAKMSCVGVSTVKKLILAFAASVALFPFTSVAFYGDFSNYVSRDQGAFAEQSCSGCISLAASVLGDYFSNDASWGQAGALAKRSGRARKWPPERNTTYATLSAFPESQHFEDSVAAPATPRIGACVLRC